MYKNIAKFENDFLAKAQSLPQNTNADGNGGAFNLAGTNGSIEVVAVVNSEISLADTKVLTVKLKDSSDGTTYADMQTIYTKTASGATTIAADTELGRFIIPTNAKPHIKANIVTTDAAATGKIDIFQNYIAR